MMDYSYSENSRRKTYHNSFSQFEVLKERLFKILQRDFFIKKKKSLPESCFKNTKVGNSLTVQWFELGAVNCRGWSLVPGWEAKILKVVQTKKKKNLKMK